MNYLQIEIGGKLRGLKFNQGAVDIYLTKLNYTEVGASTIYAAFYAGLMGNVIAKGEQSDFTYEEVTEWVDDIYENGKEEIIKQVDSVFTETNAYKKRLEELTAKVKELQGEVEDVKKNEE